VLKGTATIAKWAAKVVNLLIPNFSNYNVQNPLINPGQVIENERTYYLWTTFYGLLYIGALLVAGMWIFDRREV